MRIAKAGASGTTVTLAPDDSLDQVPETLQEIITHEGRTAFRDPRPVFWELAERCRFDSMSEWFKIVVSQGSWECIVGDLGDIPGLPRTTIFGFHWVAPDLAGAIVSLPNSSQRQGGHEDLLADYYALVDIVHWAEWDYSGGIWCAHERCGFRGLRRKVDLPSNNFTVADCTVWGKSTFGDVFLYNEEGRAALLSVEIDSINDLGTIDDAIEWVFAELIENRLPKFSY